MTLYLISTYTGKARKPVMSEAKTPIFSQKTSDVRGQTEKGLPENQ
jgi:hypothetical protein